MKLFIKIIAPIFICACAARPPVIIPEMQVQSLAQGQLGQFSVVLKKPVQMGNFNPFGQSHKLIDPALHTDTPATVQADIEKYIDSRFTVKNPNARGLKVTVENATPYQIIRAGSTFPFIGLAIATMPTSFYLVLDVNFEIEENGHVVKNYRYSASIVLSDTMASYPEQVEESYLKLIDLYREQFFSELDSQFISRYF